MEEQQAAGVIENRTEEPKPIPFRKPKKEITTRNEAMKKAKEILGPRGFARKKTKTAPGSRKQIGISELDKPTKVCVVAWGRTWDEAFKDLERYLNENPSMRNKE